MELSHDMHIWLYYYPYSIIIIIIMYLSQAKNNNMISQWEIVKFD